MKKVVLNLLFYTKTSLTFAQIASAGFFLDDWKAKTIVNPNSIVTPITTAPISSTVTIDANNVVTRVNKNLFGHNVMAYNGKINQETGPDAAIRTKLLEHISNLDASLIRFPGGNLTNEYFWKSSSAATMPVDLPPTFPRQEKSWGAKQDGWAMSLDNYYQLLQKTKTKGIICVNYSYARYGTSNNPVSVAAHYAADWVRYDNGRTKFWEIGNENFGDWQAGYVIDQAYNKDRQPATITGDLYGRHCKVFIDSMRAAAREVNSEIKIGVVTMESNGYTSVMNNWNAGMMPHIADKADFLAVHSYFTPNNQNSGIDVILNSAVDETKAIKDYVLGKLQQYGGGVTTLPLGLTEWNIFALGRQQQTSYINGIHAALLLGEMMKNKYGQATRWDLINGWDNGDNHGLFVQDEPNVTTYTPRAPYFYMYYFNKFFGDKLVTSTVTGNAAVKSYASTFSSGQTGVVLVNTGNASQTVDLKFANFSVGKKFHYYILTGGTEAEFSRKVFVNGISTPQASGGPSDYATKQPYGTDIVNNSVKINLPKYSVAYVLVENSVATATPEINVKQGLNGIINTSGSYTFNTPITVGATSNPVTFTIQNTGVANLNVGTIVLGGTNPAQFTVSQVTNPNLQPTNGSATFTITFKPTFEGFKTAIVFIPNNDSNESPYTFIVNATATITTNLESNSALEGKKISIFPNPSSNGIFNLSKDTNWRVLSVLGDELESGNGTQINLSMYRKGVYLVEIDSIVQKVILE